MKFILVVDFEGELPQPPHSQTVACFIHSDTLLESEKTLKRGRCGTVFFTPSSAPPEWVAGMTVAHPSVAFIAVAPEGEKVQTASLYGKPFVEVISVGEFSRRVIVLLERDLDVPIFGRLAVATG